MAKEPMYPHIPRGESRSPHFPLKEEISKKKAEIASLIYQGELSFEEEDYNAALWRLVDAAGMLVFFSSGSAIGKHDNPTGRGFYIAIKSMER